VEVADIVCLLLDAFQSIYAIIILLPFGVFSFVAVFDYQAYDEIVYNVTYVDGVEEYNVSPYFIPQWIWFAYGVNAYGPDTAFYALNILLVVRVYSKVMWQIPVGIYRLIRKLKKPTNVIHVMPMNSNNNQQQQSQPNNDKWAEVPVESPV
jgi:hypothetical protein